jgi:glycerophosphoryl diester phosphodiesterase/peptidoglycan hydrolase-like protein with peptidoglycan-binding domain
MSVHGPGGFGGAGRVGSGSSGAFGAVGEGEGGAAAPRLASPQLSGDETLAGVLRGERTLARGSRGESVKKLQEALAALGHDVGRPDGAWGPKTDAAVRAAQGRAGLRESGVLDAETLRALDRRLLGMDGAAAPAAPARPASPAATPPPVDLDAAMRAAAGLPPRRPGERPVTDPGRTGPASGPATPADPYANWFTDADELEAPSDVRRYLDQALRTGRHEDIRALRNLDVNMASPAEKARLVALLLEGHTDDADEEWVLELLQKDPREGERIVDELARRGKLSQLTADFHGAEYDRLLRLLPKLANDAGTTAALVGAVLESDTRQNRLAAHHIFDRARAGKYLDASLAQLRRAHPTSAVVLDLISQAKPTRRPAVVAHRGGPPDQVENTMPAIRAAVAGGVEAVEIDLTVTRDGEVILWHDYEPGGIVPWMRSAGMEPGTRYKPLWPTEGGAVGKAIHELNWDAVRLNHGYAARDGNIFTNEKLPDAAIPRFEEVARYAKEHPELKTLFLDVKLPPDRPDVHRRFAQALKPILERHGLEKRVVLLHNTASVVSNLKKDLGEKYPISHDVEIVSLAPSASDYSAVDAARRLNDRVASVGRPRIGVDGYDVYMDVLRADRRKIDASGRPMPLYTWTINDELEMREIMAIGVDGILTDRPDLLRKLNRIYGFDK